MPKMRTIDEAFAYLVETDPDTAVTKYALRRMVTTGAIPSVMLGKKYIVDIEAVELYLSGATSINEGSMSTGKTRLN